MTKTTAKSSKVKFRANKKSPRKRKSWDESWQDLVAFWRQHGHCNVPHRGDYRSLGQWVSKQKRTKDQLSSQQVEKLDEISFNWAKQADAHQEMWNRNLEKLKEFKKEHGHVKVPITYEEDPSLATWVAEQRKKYRKGKLSEDRTECLDELGMIWNIHQEYERSTTFSDHAWKDMMDRMRQFHQTNGHCLVPRDYTDQKLSSWVARQRTRYFDGELPESRIEELNKIGFVWRVEYDDAASSLYQRHWDEMLDKLIRFKNEFGHTQVTASFNNEQGYENLGQWVHMERSLYHNDHKSLTAKRKKKLDDIGFWWGRNDGNDEQGDRYQIGLETKWNSMLEELKSYQQTHGDLLVNTNKKENGRLGGWVHVQRIFYNRGSLRADRFEKLEAIGFPWAARELRIEQQWMTMYEKLLDFLDEIGSCAVPSMSTDQKLARWIQKQRREFKLGTISDERKHLLNAADFIWEIGKGQYDRNSYY